MLKYARRYFYYYENYMFKRLFDTAGAAVPLRLPEGAAMHIIEDVSGIRTLKSSGYDLTPCPFYQKLEEKVASGAVVFFVFAGKEFVHASWLFMDHKVPPFDGVFRKVNRRDSSYIGPCLTAQKYRGKGIYPYILDQICEFARRRGAVQALINTKITNLPSIHSIKKAGFSRMMKFSSRRFLFWDFYKTDIEN